MTKIISHRGAAGLALENSFKSINSALNFPLYAIEIDVRRTYDDHLILLHDMHTGRVARRRAWPEDVTLDQIRKIRLKNGEKIPTLEETFKLVGDKRTLMLDIKSHGTVKEMLRLLKQYPEVNVFFCGRQYGDLKELHQARPDIQFLVQHHYDPMEIIHRAKRLGARGICLNMWLMNPLTYRLAKREGLEIYVYTINRRWLVSFFEKLYPESIIITNHPERLV
jgi:glycerophosphoryl diester phosphodiesterase